MRCIFNQKVIKFYLLINSLYLAFIAVILFSFDSRTLKGIIAIPYSITASFAEIKDWYPNYHNYIYDSVICLRILLIGFLLFVVYYILKNGQQIKQKLNEKTPNIRFKKFILQQAIITVFHFSFYLALYFISMNFLGHSQHQVFQIFTARGFLFLLIAQILFLIYHHSGAIYQFLKNFILKPEKPYNIAIFRILFFGYLIKYIYLIKLHTALPIVSLTSRQDLPLLHWLIEFLPISPELYQFFAYLGIIACLFVILGFKTRFFLVVNAFTIFYTVATPNFFGKLWHEQIFIWVSWFFTFSRCYDAFSLDAFLRKTPIIKSPNYTYPIRFIWVSLGIIYFWASFYKLWDAGFDWALSKSMVNQVQLEWVQAYDTIPRIRIDHFPILLYLGGIATILFELVYILFIFKPKTRILAIIGGLTMHNLIGYFMYISFFWGLQVFYLFYFNFNWFFKEKVKLPVKNNLAKMGLYLGIIIICLNFLCGMLSIDSYPFSAYPKYAMLIDDNLKIIHFEIDDNTKEEINVHDIGKKNDFRWEDYGWLEYNLIRDYENGIDITKRLYDYWEIWTNNNPELKKYRQVDVSIIERPVAPEGRNQTKTLAYMTTLNVTK